MDTRQPLISVVLLSYNRPLYLREALSALASQSYERLEIVVIDNPSPASGEIAELVRQYPQIKLLQSSSNLGYTGGMNKGIESVSGDYICLTEDDIVMHPDCIRNFFEYLDGHPETGLIAPMILNKASGTIRWVGGNFELGGVYKMKIFGAGETDTGQFAEPFEVNFIDGATMFARTDLWRRLNGFRDDFFMYVEAVEFSARVGLTGQKLVVVPRARVDHFEPPDKPTPPEIEFHKIKNFFALYLLHAPLANLPEFLLRYGGLNTLRAAFSRRGNTRLTLRALWWVAKNTPRLLRERRRGVPQLSALETKPPAASPLRNEQAPQALNN